METPNNNTPPQKESISKSWGRLWRSIQTWFIDLVDLKEGMDREGTVISIKNGKMMRGANAWMLICSIMIASLGLDLNSGAVIIGAMLISPLMSPILGIGLGVSINDRDALVIALKQFGISIIIALVTSTLYFRFTPLGDFTEMIASRTAPTLLDGFVAIFGGLAGIISITRKDKSNAIPGVAIATALMPPLCVTGYGIANGDLSIALNSFYLFFLNSFFIAVTSYLIIRLLNFPFRQHPDVKDARRAKFYLFIFSLVLIIPGIIIFKDVIQDLRYKQAVKTFVENEFGSDCVNHRVFNITPDSNLLVVQLINRELSDSLKLSLNEKLSLNPYLRQTYLQAIPDYRFQLEELDRKTLEFNQVDVIANRLEALQQKQLEDERRDSLEQALIQQQQRHQLDSTRWEQLTKNIQMASQFKMLDTISFGLSTISDFKAAPKKVGLFLVHWNNRPNRRNKKNQEQALSQYLNNYFDTYAIQIDTFVVHSYD